MMMMMMMMMMTMMMMNALESSDWFVATSCAFGISCGEITFTTNTCIIIVIVVIISNSNRHRTSEQLPPLNSFPML